MQSTRDIGHKVSIVIKRTYLGVRFFLINSYVWNQLTNASNIYLRLSEYTFFTPEENVELRESTLIPLRWNLMGEQHSTPRAGLSSKTLLLNIFNN